MKKHIVRLGSTFLSDRKGWVDGDNIPHWLSYIFSEKRSEAILFGEAAGREAFEAVKRIHAAQGVTVHLDEVEFESEEGGRIGSHAGSLHDAKSEGGTT
jgi:hypothetical protein